MAKTVVDRSVELFNDESFRYGPAHPQGWEYAVACLGYRKPLAHYWWEIAYTEARLERALEQGKAEMGSWGINYTAFSDKYREKLHNEWIRATSEIVF